MRFASRSGIVALCAWAMLNACAAVSSPSRSPIPGFPEDSLSSAARYVGGTEHAAKFETARAYAAIIHTAAYLLITDGVLVDAYGDISAEYRLHSIRKSLLSALYGIAVEEGEIDLQETVASLGIGDYTPLTPRERSATVVDLLGSRSGIYLPATHENPAFDDVRPARGSFAPGAHWYYSNWDFNALGTIYQVRTGRSICRSFAERIAEPIGMQDFSSEDCAWRYSARSRHPAYVFRMSARDLARFGYLYLLGGRWHDEQTVPKDWIASSTRLRSDVVRPDGTPLPGVGYGYMWWTARDGRSHFADIDIDVGPGAFIASGTGTQLLLVAPARKLVFVHRTNTDLPSDKFRAISQTETGELLRLLLQIRAEID
jgi:CubicO group peptidase (beta-lactamase class C family)